MSEQNILNATSASFLNPAFGYDDELQTVLQEFMSDSGRYSSRLGSGLGRIFNLQWKGIPDASAAALRQWEAQYRQGFFTLADYDRSRYFTGHFKGPLTYTNAGNQSKNVTGVFEELCGLPMFQYPRNWGVDSVFVEEIDDFGGDNVKLNGSWFHDLSGTYHGGGIYKSAAAGATAEWLYFGYGFRLWAHKAADFGIATLSCQRVSDDSFVLGFENIDLYNASVVTSAPIAETFAIPLDFYRVRLAVSGTKNGASSGFNVAADAIEVMQ